ncbi:putative immunity protein [Chitinophaga sp. ARDCPP14]|uniref:putative immunity protein n=1 Tax=Chitinophaga sp. ARDCPP14 TaxID=3391139 RepID=UPI003F527CF8
MILPKQRDPRFITIRRGGTLTDTHHHLLALWAASCAEHVLHLFEQASDDDRPQQAIALTRAWVNGEITMKEAHKTAFATNAAAKGLPDVARFAALAAGQAVAVAHVAAHELGAAAYAIRAAMESVPENEKDEMRRKECQWQREQLPDAIRELVLDDQQLRNNICWFVFSL